MAETFPVEQRGIGNPDYAAPKPVGQVPIGSVYTLTDIGELAARLGSIVTHDRRGNVICLDDFESPVLSWSEYSLLGGTQHFTSSHCMDGAQAIQLTPGSNLGAVIELTKLRATPVLSNFGAEIGFSTSDTDFTGYFTFMLDVDDGENRLAYRILYNKPDKKFRIWHNGAYVDLLSYDYYFGPDEFQIIKIVVDPANRKYLRFIFNNIEYDISNYTPGIMVAAIRGQILAGIHCQAKVAGSWPVFYIDNFILTRNEPENISKE